jgi:hypothetical protein
MKSSARLINVFLGVWLFISAFAWAHTDAQFANSWVCGVLCVIFSLVALGYPPARYLNTVLSIWIFVSAWILPTREVATVWSNVFVALSIFLVSLIPSEREPVRSMPYPVGRDRHGSRGEARP